MSEAQQLKDLEFIESEVRAMVFPKINFNANTADSVQQRLKSARQAAQAFAYLNPWSETAASWVVQITDLITED